MTMPTSNRRRPRTSSCSVTSTRRRIAGMGMKSAITLLALLHSPTSLPTKAFTQPISNVRRISQHSQHSFSQILYTSNNHEVDINAPIRTNQILSRLTQEEEVTLLQTMRAYPSHNPISQKARQTLLLHNLPLVQSIVTKILRSRPHLLKNNKGGKKGNSDDKVGAALSKNDLLHEGTIGLAEAIDRYDLAYAQTSKDSAMKKKKMMTKTTTNSITHPGITTTPLIPTGARLGTYATYWIRARIIRAIQSREHVFRFPEHVLQASHRLVKATEKMGLQWHVVTELADYDVITVAQKKLRDELCIVAGIKSDGLFREAVRVRTMSQVGSTTPLESWMMPSSSSLLATSGRSVFDDQTSLEEEGGGQEHIVETLSKFLVPREVEVLSLRYGLVSADEAEGSYELPQRVFRDYEAEAEEDLFGPNGVLSHYSETAAESIAAVAASTSKSTKSAAVVNASSSTQTPRKVKMMTSASNTLLPFKEIGKRMQFSGEYCRRTCSVALDKLTRAVEEGRLAESDFLLGFS